MSDNWGVALIIFGFALILIGVFHFIASFSKNNLYPEHSRWQRTWGPIIAIVGALVLHWGISLL